MYGDQHAHRHRFVNNRSQAVRIPLDVRLPEGGHKVDIRVSENLATI